MLVCLIRTHAHKRLLCLTFFKWINQLIPSIFISLLVWLVRSFVGWLFFLDSIALHIRYVYKIWSAFIFHHSLNASFLFFFFFFFFFFFSFMYSWYFFTFILTLGLNNLIPLPPPVSVMQYKTNRWLTLLLNLTKIPPVTSSVNCSMQLLFRQVKLFPQQLSWIWH